MMAESKTETFEKEIKELQAKLTKAEQDRDLAKKELSDKEKDVTRLRTAISALQGKPVMQTTYSSDGRTYGEAAKERLSLGQQIRWKERDVKKAHGKEKQVLETELSELTKRHAELSLQLSKERTERRRQQRQQRKEQVRHG